ncbi:GNAT family protein [Paucibacter sp. APW11]|uniref:GNAT family protein n=1 Tax=Roseateles aquae TaxID=3077235 RepID=A0ABU3PFI4_9BURK|nr:GNAT family protein [Paucibacter sp. APW11]MDT9001308.1 GNAT family protein [Paucibacter sp. APW11]
MSEIARPDPVLIKVAEEIETERLMLAMPRAGLGQALNAAVIESLDALRPWAVWAQKPPTIEESEAVVRQVHADFILRKELRYYFYRKTEDGRAGRLLGNIGLQNLDWQLRAFEMGYWVRSSAAGQGYVSEAVRALTRMAFESLRARRVQLLTDERNLKSRAVAERCGYELEGVLRSNALDVHGEPRNTCVFARLA